MSDKLKYTTSFNLPLKDYTVAKSIETVADNTGYLVSTLIKQGRVLPQHKFIVDFSVSTNNLGGNIQHTITLIVEEFDD